jgi:hypothetical protein
MVYFQTKNPYLGKFWRALDWKMLMYFMVIWNILLPFGIFYCHLEYFTAIWNILLPFGIFYSPLITLWYIFGYISPRFGILCQEKSGKPARGRALDEGKNVGKTNYRHHSTFCVPR